MRRLLPDPGETTLADQLALLDFTAQAHADRPYTVTNFALTLDGRATIDGRSGPIGSDLDTALLVGLRTDGRCADDRRRHDARRGLRAASCPTRPSASAGSQPALPPTR